MKEILMTESDFRFVKNISRWYYTNLIYKGFRELIEQDDLTGELMELWAVERKKYYNLDPPMFTNHFKLKSWNWLKNFKESNIVKEAKRVKRHDLSSIKNDYLTIADNGKFKYSFKEVCSKYGFAESHMRVYLSSNNVTRHKAVDWGGFDWYYLASDKGQFKYSLKELATLTNISYDTIRKYSNHNPRKLIQRRLSD